MEDYPGNTSQAGARGGEIRPRATDGGEGSDDWLDLGTLLHRVWRNKLLVAAFGLGFGLAAIALVYSLTPRYTSTSVVMMDQNQEQVIDLESVVSSFSANYYSISAEAEVLRSRALAGRVVDKANLTEHPYFNPDLREIEEPGLVASMVAGAINLVKDTIRDSVSESERPGREAVDPDYWIRERAIDRLLDTQNVMSRSDTYVYAITVETEDPVLSAKLANEFADLYIVDQLESKFEATEAATEWLANRVGELKAELESAEAAVETYSSSTSLVSEEALAALSRQVKDLRERRSELDQRREDTQARRAALAAALETGDSARAAEIAGVPRMRALAADIAGAGAAGERAALEARFRSLGEMQLARLETEAERAERQIESLESSIADLETRFESQSADLVQLRQLQREAEAKQRIYEQFLRRLNETSVQQGVHQADARVLSPAIVNLNPSFPRKTLIVATAGFVGGIIGIVFVLMLEQFNKAFRSPEELEGSTGLPVLGAIPIAPVRMRRGLLDYAVDRSSSALVEAIRNLRTGIMLANVDHTPQVIMLTSSLPKEGKTTCSLLLAQNSSGLGKKVLLIECDLRRRTFRSYFTKAPRAGLMSALTGENSFDDVVHHDERTGMDVIMGEETQANAADVFASERFRKFLEEARRRYDFVVIDTPPVLAVPDGRVIAPLTDAVLYCVRWNATHRDLVRNGINQLSQIGVRVSGLALTQINTRKMAKYGYGGYSYYYYKSSRRYYVN